MPGDVLAITDINTIHVLEADGHGRVMSTGQQKVASATSPEGGDVVSDFFHFIHRHSSRLCRSSDLFINRPPHSAAEWCSLSFISPLLCGSAMTP